MSEGYFAADETFETLTWEDEESSIAAREDIDYVARSEVVRQDVVESIVKMLSADAERCDGSLNRSDANLAYHRKGLTISECIEVEQGILNAGYAIVEDETDVVPEQNGNESLSRRFLSDTEERELGRQIQLALRLPRIRDGLDPSHVERILRDAEKARAMFVATNVLFVEMLARRLGERQHLTLDDLRQEGLIGLLKAAEAYDPDLGFRFKTYASWWIQQKMYRAIADGDRTIRLPVHVGERVTKIKRARRRLTITSGRTPSDAELANALGMNLERLAKLMWLVQATECLEADAPSKEGNLPRIELIEDECPTPFEALAFQQLQQRFRVVLDTLTPREALIVRMRFGIDADQSYTLDSLGKRLDLTRERVRQIEANALKKLRAASRKDQLLDFEDM